MKIVLNGVIVKFILVEVELFLMPVSYYIRHYNVSFFYRLACSVLSWWLDIQNGLIAIVNLNSESGTLIIIKCSQNINIIWTRTPVVASNSDSASCVILVTKPFRRTPLEVDVLGTNETLLSQFWISRWDKLLSINREIQVNVLTDHFFRASVNNLHC